jgi:4-hydroxybenzoate polyprenyltransferase
VNSELVEESIAIASPPDTQDVPLCVDLDGTLLRTDLFYESLLVLLARNPFHLFLLPLWLWRGKAALKREVASRVTLDMTTLPYDDRVIAVLAASNRRQRVLCTASDSLFAEQVAAHLGLFDLVLASDGELNLSGKQKAAVLVGHFGERGFDYAGNEAADLHVWRHARRAWVVNASDSLAAAAARECPVETRMALSGGGVKTWLKAIRVHQWLKNLLVLVPLLASHRFFEAGAVGSALLAFLAFSLCASGVYVLNDLLDLTADRSHPRKRMRPFAAGSIPLPLGILAAPVLTVAGFLLALLVGPAFALVLAVYYLTTFAYSLRLKRVVMLDVVVLAGLYTIRIIGGAIAIGSVLSFWLLAFSMFTFLSLAMLKRYTELGILLANSKGQASGRGYNVEDLPLIQSLGAASGYLAVLVLALYINSPESLALYHRPQVLWLLCPLLLYWMSRVWVIAHRGEMNDDPVVFAALDRVSQVVLLLCGVIAMVAI